MKNKLLIATTNPAKFKQMKEYLLDLDYELLSLADLNINFDVQETGKTFEENALLKATTYAHHAGILTLADDSGLEVQALNGEPGIYSSRYAGPNKTDDEKIQFLLAKMKDKHNRDAQFTSVVALAWPDERTKTFTGISYGTIAFKPRGSARKGFPYYRIYELKPYNKTVAELIDEKMPFKFHRHYSLDQVKEYLSHTK